MRASKIQHRLLKVIAVSQGHSKHDPKLEIKALTKTLNKRAYLDTALREGAPVAQAVALLEREVLSNPGAVNKEGA